MTIERAVTRRLPIGAEVQADGDVHFRFWAPACTSVSIVIVDESETGLGPRRRPLTDPVRLARAPRDGYFEGSVPSARIGSRYFVQLGDSDHDWYPDPASRFQPYGPHGPSEVVDPTYTWHDDGWRGLTAEAPVIYELHIGTFTLEGTFLAAARELPALAELGISTIEVLPLSEFPGRFGWGYDGVLPFAPSHTYGRPEDLRAFVDAAHWLGLAVILDVVYNHFGPDGCVVQHFAPQFFSDHPTEWGDGLNFDAPGSAGVREFVRANARYWITEFHLDGLRLDATQSIEDSIDAAHPRGNRERGPRERRAQENVHRRRERAAAQSSDETAIRGRLRARRALERRLSSQRDGRADRPARSLLHRLSRRGAGVRHRGTSRIPVPGAVVFVADAAARIERRADYRRAPSSRFFRITIRSPTRSPAGACTSSPSPGVGAR